MAHLTAEEIEQLLRPEIPLELWRKGEAPFERKMERLARQQVVNLAGRDITNNPATRKIKAERAELRKLIANAPKLVKDFEFFTEKLGWHPEELLQHLHSDSDIMHASQQTITAREKKRHWPVDRNALRALSRKVSALALRLEELNKTDFSPARTVILRTADGVPLPREQQRYLLQVFRDLPEILRCFG